MVSSLMCPSDSRSCLHKYLLSLSVFFSLSLSLSLFVCLFLSSLPVIIVMSMFLPLVNQMQFAVLCSHPSHAVVTAVPELHMHQPK